MTAAATVPTRGPFGPALSATLTLVGAAAVGALFALGAYFFGPIAALGLLALVPLAAMSIARPLVAVCTALVLLAVGNLGHTGSPPWVLGTAWSGLALVAAVLRTRHAGRGLPPLAVPVVLFAGATAVQLLITDDPGAGLPWVRALLSGVCLFFAVALVVRSRSDVLFLLAAAATVALSFVVSGFVSPERLDVGFITTGGAIEERLTIGYLAPNALGGLLVMLIPLVIAGAILQPRLRPAWIAVAALTTVALVSTYSRGALVALPIVPLLFLRRRQIALAVPALIVVVLVATPSLVRERFANVSTTNADVATRVDIWGAAVDVWQSEPILGVGVGAFPRAYAEVGSPSRMYLPNTVFAPPPHAHSLFLQVLSEQGAVGVVAFLLLLALVTRLAVNLRRSHDRVVRTTANACLATLLVVLVHGVFDVTLYESAGVWFWTTLGLLSATAAAQRERG